jgi:hypothetical protein
VGTRPTGTAAKSIPCRPGPLTRRVFERAANGDKEFVGNKGYRKFLREESSTHFQLDEDKVKEEARYDGHWVLRTIWRTNRNSSPLRLAGPIAALRCGEHGRLRMN